VPLVDHLPACNRLSRAPQAALVADTGMLVSVPVISSDAAGAKDGWPWTTPTGCALWPLTTRGLPKTVSAEPESTPSSIRRPGAGAAGSVGEIVDVLVGVVPIIELPCVAAAAPKLAMVGTPVQWVISPISQAVRLPLHTNRVSRLRQVRDPSTRAMNLSQRARSESVGGGHFSSPGRLRVWRVALRAPHLGPTRKLLLLARYFARRVMTIAINANAAKTTAAMPIFFICSHLPKD
jgi:hypothetical protein